MHHHSHSFFKNICGHSFMSSRPSLHVFFFTVKSRSEFSPKLRLPHHSAREVNSNCQFPECSKLTVKSSEQQFMDSYRKLVQQTQNVLILVLLIKNTSEHCCVSLQLQLAASTGACWDPSSQQPSDSDSKESQLFSLFP